MLNQDGVSQGMQLWVPGIEGLLYFYLCGCCWQAETHNGVLLCELKVPAVRTASLVGHCPDVVLRKCPGRRVTQVCSVRLIR